MEKFEEMVNQTTPEIEVADRGRISQFRVAMAWMALARWNPDPPGALEASDEP